MPSIPNVIIHPNISFSSKLAQLEPKALHYHRGVLMAKFLINSDTNTPQPQNMSHPPRPEIGTTIAGKPVKQGYPSLQVVYEILSYAKMAKLMSLYNPASPGVTITYDDPITGSSISKNAYMHEPTIGARQTLYHRDVSVLFTHLT
jgi:hypothetical protein